MANVLGQGRGVVAKAEGGLEGRGDGAKAVGRGQGCGGVAKSVGAWPSTWGAPKAVGAWARRLGRGQDRWCEAKAEVKASLRPWGCNQGRGGVVKSVGA